MLVFKIFNIFPGITSDGEYDDFYKFISSRTNLGRLYLPIITLYGNGFLKMIYTGRFIN